MSVKASATARPPPSSLGQQDQQLDIQSATSLHAGSNIQPPLEALRQLECHGQ